MKFVCFCLPFHLLERLCGRGCCAATTALVGIFVAVGTLVAVTVGCFVLVLTTVAVAVATMDCLLGYSVTVVGVLISVFVGGGVEVGVTVASVC